ncbi:MAG: MMPL family transporter [Deltaproteobacteria bacterium]|nr:MMPL family transporter [Deltaproteobacteria bacterium]
MIHITDWVLKRPWLTIGLTVLSFFVFGFGMRGMSADTDVTRDLPQNIPAKLLYDRIDEMFPAKETIIVVAESEDHFSVEGLAKLDALTRVLEKVEGVQSVMSLTTARLITADENGMVVQPAGDPLPQTPEEAASLKERLYGQPLYVGTLLSEDGTAVATLAMVKSGAREADVAERILAIADDPAQSQGLKLHVTGRGAANYWGKVLMGRDMGMLSSAALGIVFLLLLIIFRSFRGLLLPLGVVITAIIWTMGLMGYLAIPLTHSTEVMPILLLAIGVADGIHILKGYYERARGESDARAVVRATMVDLNRPVVLTSITTMVGFISLASSGVASIEVLGYLTAFGVFAAMIFSVTLIPAVLVLLKVPQLAEEKKARFLWAEAFAGRYAALLARRRWAVLGGILAVIGLSIWGATRVPVEMSTTENFAPDHPLRVATEAVNRHFAATTNLTVVVEGSAADAIKDPVVLERMDALQTWLESQPHVGKIQSITGFIKQMHRVMHGDAPEQFRLPQVMEKETGTEWVERDGVEVEEEVTFEVPGKELVAQYLALYEMSGKPDDFANLVTYDYRTARMNVFLSTDRATHLTTLHDDLKVWLAENFSGVEGLQAQLTGMAELIRAVNDMLVEGQAWSIALSLLLVWLVTALIFRSPVLGLFATLPLFFSLFLNFGTMGLSGIALNVMTMATSSVAVGVGIDYAIHFIHRYQVDRRTGATYEHAAASALRTSGVAIAFNAAAVALGFSALGLSAFKGVSDMGILIALTMVTSAFAALTILPVLFIVLKPRAFAVAPGADAPKTDSSPREAA